MAAVEIKGHFAAIGKHHWCRDIPFQNGTFDRAKEEERAATAAAGDRNVWRVEGKRRDDIIGDTAGTRAGECQKIKAVRIADVVEVECDLPQPRA